MDRYHFLINMERNPLPVPSDEELEILLEDAFNFDRIFIEQRSYMLRHANIVPRLVRYVRPVIPRVRPVSYAAALINEGAVTQALETHAVEAPAVEVCCVPRRRVPRRWTPSISPPRQRFPPYIPGEMLTELVTMPAPEAPAPEPAAEAPAPEPAPEPPAPEGALRYAAEGAVAPAPTTPQ
ncbi:hypothetical protein P8452_34346 [Trifolium repens]|nr:hypothetical protein P8452_34346 [Trifolium repens]